MVPVMSIRPPFLIAPLALVTLVVGDADGEVVTLKFKNAGSVAGKSVTLRFSDVVDVIDVFAGV